MFNVFKEERRRAHERLIKESPEEIARKQARRQARRDKYAAKQKERLNQWISKLRSYPELIGEPIQPFISELEKTRNGAKKKENRSLFKGSAHFSSRKYVPEKERLERVVEEAKSRFDLTPSKPLPTKFRESADITPQKPSWKQTSVHGRQFDNIPPVEIEQEGQSAYWFGKYTFCGGDPANTVLTIRKRPFIAGNPKEDEMRKQISEPLNNGLPVKLGELPSFVRRPQPERFIGGPVSLYSSSKPLFQLPRAMPLEKKKKGVEFGPGGTGHKKATPRNVHSSRTKHGAEFVGKRYWNSTKDLSCQRSRSVTDVRAIRLAAQDILFKKGVIRRQAKTI